MLTGKNFTSLKHLKFIYLFSDLHQIELASSWVLAGILTLISELGDKYIINALLLSLLKECLNLSLTLLVTFAINVHG